MLPTKFQFIWESDLRGEDFQKSTNQKQKCPVAAMFANGSELNQQFSVHLAEGFQIKMRKVNDAK